MVKELFKTLFHKKRKDSRVKEEPRGFTIGVTIPLGEADKLRSHESFMPALRQRQKGNWSSALKLLEKVLKSEPRSKYILLLKAECICRIAEDEKMIQKLPNVGKVFLDKVSRGRFDSESFDLFIRIGHEGINLHKEAIQIMEEVMIIDPNFTEAERLLQYCKRAFPDLIKAKRDLDKTLLEVLKDNLVHLKPREFESFISYLFNKMGFHVEITPYVSDFGADIVAERGGNRIVIQVKKYIGANVGAQEVQQTLGSMWKYRLMRQ